ncbi:CshA/CshB family fibrillar adhesin-related protein [Microbacterium sp. NPDC089695]|uniref:CshA/CshB family fibrillar adhesin-related protein n=1 Tax=Microbacterium sp. NPDC089695 TaxID=3364198 RepID=UPI0037FE15E8
MRAEKSHRRGATWGAHRRAACIAGFAILLGGAGASAVVAPPDAAAVPATGGAGRFLEAIDWIVWGGDGQALPNSGFQGTTTRVVGGVTVTTTCTASDVSGTQADQTAPMLTAYRPGSWQGDGLDELYNIGGPNASNSLVNGLANAVSGSRVDVDVSCVAATASGGPVPLAGLVVADAEQSITEPNQMEYVQAAPSSSATWRVIDRHRSEGCTSSTSATRDTQNVLRLAGPPSLCAEGPTAVAFMEGATSARIELQGGGVSALALGVVLVTDFGDAPTGYGVAGHIGSPTYAGGTLPVGTPTDVNDETFLLGWAGGGAFGLGAEFDPETAGIPSVGADGDDLDGVTGVFGPADDEDALADTSITGQVGGAYRATVTCHTPGGVVAGWIDWNIDGDFVDDAERSSTAVCLPDRTAVVSWTIPSTVVGRTAGAATYLRLRAAATEEDVAAPSGLAFSGEVEDHRVTLDLTTTVEIVKEVESRASSADQFTVGLALDGLAVASVTTAGADAGATTGRMIVAPGTAYAVTDAVVGSAATQYLPGVISCTVDDRPIDASGAAPRWTIPPLLANQDARCVITNEAVAASVAFDKTSGGLVDADHSGGPSVGDVIDYAFEIVNTGNAEVSGIAVADPAIAVACPSTKLAAGAALTCGPVSYTLTSRDLAAGRVVNSATVSATGPDGDRVTASDTVTTVFGAVVPPTAAPPSARPAAEGLAESGGAAAVAVAALAALAAAVGVLLVVARRHHGAPWR